MAEQENNNQPKIFSANDIRFHLFENRIRLGNKQSVVSRSLDRLYEQYGDLCQRIHTSKVVEGVSAAVGFLGTLACLPSAEEYFDYPGADLSTPQGRALVAVAALGFATATVSAAYQKFQFNELDELNKKIDAKEEVQKEVESQLQENERQEGIVDIAEAIFGKKPVAITGTRENYSVRPATQEEYLQATKPQQENYREINFTIPSTEFGISSGTEMITPVSKEEFISGYFAEEDDGEKTLLESSYQEDVKKLTESTELAQPAEVQNAAPSQTDDGISQ